MPSLGISHRDSAPKFLSSLCDEAKDDFTVMRVDSITTKASTHRSVPGKLWYIRFIYQKSHLCEQGEYSALLYVLWILQNTHTLICTNETSCCKTLSHLYPMYDSCFFMSTYTCRKCENTVKQQTLLVSLETQLALWDMNVSRLNSQTLNRRQPFCPLLHPFSDPLWGYFWLWGELVPQAEAPVAIHGLFSPCPTHNVLTALALLTLTRRKIICICMVKGLLLW